MKIKIINQIIIGISKYFSTKQRISLLLVISFILAAFTLLILTQIERRKSILNGWERIGFDESNTNFFRNQIYPQTQYQSWSGTKKTSSAGVEKENLVLVWSAEEFSPEPFRFVGGIHKLNYNLRTCDLNSDGKLEIIINYQGQTLILNSQGIFQYSIPYVFDFYIDEERNVHSITCSLNMIRYSLNKKRNYFIQTIEPIITATITKLKDNDSSKVEILTIEKIISSDEVNQFQISCYDPITGKCHWFHQFYNLIFISAIGDINKDNTNEIICTTFSPDKVFGEIIAISGSGRKIWQYEFGIRNELSYLDFTIASYTDAAIADLNGDGKLEVVGIFGTEDGSLGRLVIFDGKTGNVIEQYPKNRFLRRAFSSLAIADLDYDGISDIITATRGVSARIYTFRLGSSGLEVLAARRYFPFTIREPGIVTSVIWALADIDSDNEVEILSSIVYEMPSYVDWSIRTTRFLEPSIIVLDNKFKEKYNIDLEERCLGMIVSSLTKKSHCEILVLSDRLYLYAIQ